MANIKTVPTTLQVSEFISLIENPIRKHDAITLLEIFERLTEQKAAMWGSSIIGFGEYTYSRKDGSTHSFMRSGFSPREQNLSIYVGAGMAENPNLLEGLGKYKTSKACLYITKLSNIDLPSLERIISFDSDVMNKRYPK